MKNRLNITEFMIMASLYELTIAHNTQIRKHVTILCGETHTHGSYRTVLDNMQRKEFIESELRYTNETNRYYPRRFYWLTELGNEQLTRTRNLLQPFIKEPK